MQQFNCFQFTTNILLLVKIVKFLPCVGIKGLILQSFCLIHYASSFFTLFYSGKGVGEAKYKALTVKLAAANRIYQSGANLLDTVRSLANSAHSVAEITVQHTGEIGNALRESGVVAENAYDEMIEKVNPHSAAISKLANFSDTLDNVEDAFSSIGNVSSEVVEIRENVTQLRDEKKQFLDTIEEEKKVLKQETEQDKEDSEAKTDVEDIDFEKAPSEGE